MGEDDEKRCSVCVKTSKWFKVMPLQYNNSEKGLVCASCYSNPESFREVQKFRLINTALQLQNHPEWPMKAHGRNRSKVNSFIEWSKKPKAYLSYNL